MDWFSITGSYILSIMPASNKVIFDNWIAGLPQKAERIEIIVENVVAQFRSILLTNPLNVLDPDPTKLPQPMIRTAELLTLGAIYQEMEKILTDIEQSQLIRAEISLRTFQVSKQVFTAPNPNVGIPTYSGLTRPVFAPDDPAETDVQPPVFNPGEDSYNVATLDVKATTSTPGAVIRYTLDNTEPTSKSPSVISGETIEIPIPSTLKAFAFRRNMTNSETITAAYSLSAEVGALFAFQASSVITNEAQLVAWSNTVPNDSKIATPVKGNQITLAALAGTTGLIIAYPASITPFASAIQNSTGVDVRLSWINSEFSTTISRFGVLYRVYQWFPTFAWSFADSFAITL
jgi:hypothetical protein